jgi:HSP20 family protein
MYPSISLSSLWNHLTNLPGAVEDVVGTMASAPRSWWLHSFPYPLVNVREEGDALRVEAEVPGVSLEQIEVSIQHGVELTIQGERPADSAGSASWHRRERGVGRFERVLTLPVPVEVEKVEARLENGVLRLTLPKAESVKARRIPIKG